MLACKAVAQQSLQSLLTPYGVQLQQIPLGEPIPGSYWGEPEAGLIGARLYYRADTPVHSVLHEACHYICMSPQRRNKLHTNAGGTSLEECAVCYLQIILADYVSGFGRIRAFKDMDTWGYSFRLGSAQSWFEQDAKDARNWLQDQELLDHEQQPSWLLRGHAA